MLHYDLEALCHLTKLLNFYIEKGGISYSPPPSANIRYTPPNSPSLNTTCYWRVMSWRVINPCPVEATSKPKVQCCSCSVAKLCLILCDPMECRATGFPVLHCLLKFPQIHVHWVSDVLQPSHPLLPPSPPALNLSQHQGLFQWVSSSHQVVKILALQLQQPSFQWIFRVDSV